VPRGAFLVPVLLVAVVAGIVAIAARQGDAAFELRQEHPRTVQPRQLELLIEKTREPVASGRGKPVRRAQCKPGTSGPKRNPWRCTVLYESGNTIVYRVVVAPSGQFNGADRTGSYTVNGCCITGGVTPSG
jgi:hypothetical protein